MKRVVRTGYGGMGWMAAALAGVSVVGMSAAGCGEAWAAVGWGGGTQFYLAGADGNGAPAVRGAQGYLGVDVRDVSDEQVGVLKLKDARGAEITLVDHDAPAGKAGLREHDVVLQLNGQAIGGEDQIRRLLHDSAPGRTVVLVISRDGQQMTVTAQMANREEVERKAWQQHLTVPEPAAVASAVSEDTGGGYGATAGPVSSKGANGFLGTGLLMSSSYTGAMLEKMSAQLADFFGVPSGMGLLVRSVAANSPAAQAGMRAGDVVVKADSLMVANPGDWTKAIKSGHGRSVTVVVLREKKEQTLTLLPDGKKRSSLDVGPWPGGGEPAPMTN